MPPRTPSHPDRTQLSKAQALEMSKNLRTITESQPGLKELTPASTALAFQVSNNAISANRSYILPANGNSCAISAAIYLIRRLFGGRRDCDQGVLFRERVPQWEMVRDGILAASLEEKDAAQTLIASFSQLVDDMRAAGVLPSHGRLPVVMDMWSAMAGTLPSFTFTTQDLLHCECPNIILVRDTRRVVDYVEYQISDSVHHVTVAKICQEYFTGGTSQGHCLYCNTTAHTIPVVLDRLPSYLMVEVSVPEDNRIDQMEDGELHFHTQNARFKYLDSNLHWKEAHYSQVVGFLISDGNHTKAVECPAGIDGPAQIRDCLERLPLVKASSAPKVIKDVKMRVVAYLLSRDMK